MACINLSQFTTKLPPICNFKNVVKCGVTIVITLIALAAFGVLITGLLGYFGVMRILPPLINKVLIGSGSFTLGLEFLILFAVLGCKKMCKPKSIDIGKIDHIPVDPKREVVTINLGKRTYPITEGEVDSLIRTSPRLVNVRFLSDNDENLDFSALNSRFVPLRIASTKNKIVYQRW